MGRRLHRLLYHNTVVGLFAYSNRDIRGAFRNTPSTSHVASNRTVRHQLDIDRGSQLFVGMIQIQGMKHHLIITWNICSCNLLSCLNLSISYRLACIFERSCTEPAIAVLKYLMNTEFMSLFYRPVLEAGVIDHKSLVTVCYDRVVSLRTLRIVASSHIPPIAIGSKDILTTVGLASSVRTIVDTSLIIDCYSTRMIRI